jgi:hypothetical protein
MCTNEVKRIFLFRIYNDKFFDHETVKYIFEVMSCIGNARIDPELASIPVSRIYLVAAKIMSNSGLVEFDSKNSAAMQLPKYIKYRGSPIQRVFTPKNDDLMIGMFRITVAGDEFMDQYKKSKEKARNES